MIMQALRDSLSAAELVGFSATGDVAASDADKAGKAKSGKIQRGPAKVGKPQVGKVSRSPVMVGKRESAKVGKPNSRIAPAA